MKKKRLFSLLTSITLVLSCFAVHTSATETEGEQKTVFKATEEWSESSSGGENWSWEYSDKSSGYVYKKLTVACEDQSVYGTVPTDEATAANRKNGFAWKSGNAWNNAGVGQHWMVPYVKTTDTTVEERAKFSVSRTFTSPINGTISVSTEDGKIYGGAKQSGNGNTMAYVRITRNGQQIWPVEGELQLPYTGAYIQTYNFSELSNITVYRGDKVRFEVYNGDGDAGNGKMVYWAPVITYTSTEANANMVYNSDDVWPEALDGTTTITNDDPVWQFIYRNTQSNNQYKAYELSVGNQTQNYLAPVKDANGSYTYANQLGLSDGADTRTRIFTDSTTNGDKRNALGRYWMRLSVATGSEPKQNANNRIVKSFTAPRSGNVCISAADMSGDAKIYNQKLDSNNSKGAVVNILKWAPDGTNKTIWTHTFAYNANTTPADGVEVLDFENMSIYMNKGEQLWFMVSGATGGSAYAKQVFWNPVVSYYDTVEMSEDRIYKATAAWSENSGNKYNGHNEWKWEEYDASVSNPQFKELTNLIKNKARFGQIPTDPSTNLGTAPSWDQSATNSNLAGVGQNWMTPRADSGSEEQVRKNHAVSRSFTAPLTGTVILSAEDVTTDGIVHAYGGAPDPAANKPAYLRITKNGSQIWPKYDAEYKISATTTFAQDAPISPVALTINKGDVIRFEAYNGSGDVGWGKRVWWRPQVEYLNIAPTEFSAQAPVFTKASDDTVLSSFEEIVSAGTININLPIKTVNNSDKDAIMCAAIYDTNGALSSVALSEMKTITGSGTTTLTIADMSVSPLESGSIKIFLFNSMATLIPLDSIGTTSIYEVAVQ